MLFAPQKQRSQLAMDLESLCGSRQEDVIYRVDKRNRDDYCHDCNVDEEENHSEFIEVTGKKEVCLKDLFKKDFLI
jgi:hypothetical protein